MEYFTKEELKSLKQTVLRLHSLPDNSVRLLNVPLCIYFIDSIFVFQLSQEGVLVEKRNKSYSPYISELVCGLPDELWLKIYSYLNPRDLCRCAQVCKVWAGLSRDMSLWHSVWPRHWAQGEWSFTQPEDEEEEETVLNSSMLCVQRSCMGWGKEEMENNGFSLEHQILTGLVKHLLPIVGTSVKRLGLAHSRVLTNALVSTHLKIPEADRHIGSVDGWMDGYNTYQLIRQLCFTLSESN